MTHTTVYYFSGTGNSFSVANNIAKELGNTTVIPIAFAVKNDRYDCESERVGFIFPCYAYSLPMIVKRFIKKLRLSEASYIFSVVTFGTRISGTNHKLKRILAGKNLKLDLGEKIACVENYAPVFSMSNLEKQNRILNTEREECKRIIEKIENNESNKIRGGHFLGAIVSGLFTGFNFLVRRTIRFKTADCSECGLCVRICPTENIKINDGKIKFGNKCEVCLACLHVCPQKAITSFRATKNSLRYYHSNTDKKGVNKDIINY